MSKGTVTRRHIWWEEKAEELFQLLKDPTMSIRDACQNILGELYTEGRCIYVYKFLNNYGGRVGFIREMMPPGEEFDPTEYEDRLFGGGYDEAKIAELLCTYTIPEISEMMALDTKKLIGYVVSRGGIDTVISRYGFKRTREKKGRPRDAAADLEFEKHGILNLAKMLSEQSVAQVAAHFGVYDTKLTRYIARRGGISKFLRDHNLVKQRLPNRIYDWDSQIELLKIALDGRSTREAIKVMGYNHRATTMLNEWLIQKYGGVRAFRKAYSLRAPRVCKRNYSRIVGMRECSHPKPTTVNQSK